MEGINITIDGNQRNFKGGLLCVLADNLASNLLGGFKESFSFSYRFCRSCLITKSAVIYPKAAQRCLATTKYYVMSLSRVLPYPRTLRA